MVLKLTRAASETLNDIILNTLQEHGIEKAEALEDSIFDLLDEISTVSINQQKEGFNSSIVSGYAIIYQAIENDLVVLAIIHPYRLPNDANNL